MAKKEIYMEREGGREGGRERLRQKREGGAR